MPSPALTRFLTIHFAGMAFAAGLVGSRLLANAAGFSAPRLPAQAAESVAGLYLIGGSILLAGGLQRVAEGIGGSRPTRWSALSAFLYLGFGVSTTIESTIFSGTAGLLRMVPLLLLPCVLLTGLLAWPSAARSPMREREDRIFRFFRARSGSEWVLRIAGALASFPLVYFIFGLAVSPVVSDLYLQGVAGLSLPSPQVILQVQLLRSVIQVAAAFPIIIFWRGSRRHLVLGMASAFFVFVFAYDVVLAIQMPVVLVLTHGIELMADSLAYSYALAMLLGPSSEKAEPPRAPEIPA